MEDDQLDDILGGEAFSDDLSDLNDSLSRQACDDTARCRGVGLDSDEQRAASEAAARQLQADWTHLNQAQRRRRVREYVRDLGERAGLPQTVGVDFHSGSSGRAAVGIFRSYDWEMAIYEDISGNDAPARTHETHQHMDAAWSVLQAAENAEERDEDAVREARRNWEHALDRYRCVMNEGDAHDYEVDLDFVDD